MCPRLDQAMNRSQNVFRVSMRLVTIKTRLISGLKDYIYISENGITVRGRELVKVYQLRTEISPWKLNLSPLGIVRRIHQN